MKQNSYRLSKPVIHKTIFWFIKKILLVLSLLIILSLIYIFVFIKPSNNRVWEVGYEKLPQFTFNQNMVTIQDVRNYHYAPGKIISFGYLNRTIDTSKITKIWFVVEPFTNFKPIAHTYFVFDFSDQDPIAVSVEARLEKGEGYNVFFGTFNKYELMYVWSQETDATIRRAIVDNNKLYMYPLVIPQEGAQKLFLQLAETSEKLVKQPRFYNSLLSNCTNELAKAANQVKPGVIPWNIAEIMPGYSAEELYRLGYIPHDKPLEEIQNKYFISDIVKKIYNQNNFSQQLRSELE